MSGKETISTWAAWVPILNNDTYQATVEIPEFLFHSTTRWVAPSISPTKTPGPATAAASPKGTPTLQGASR